MPSEHSPVGLLQGQHNKAGANNEDENWETANDDCHHDALFKQHIPIPLLNPRSSLARIDLLGSFAEATGTHLSGNRENGNEKRLTLRELSALTPTPII